VTVSDESGEAADGEEITNKIPRIEGGLKEDGSRPGGKSTNP
jgi:hypothetical protein